MRRTLVVTANNDIKPFKFKFNRIYKIDWSDFRFPRRQNKGESKPNESLKLIEYFVFRSDSIESGIVMKRKGREGKATIR